MVHKFPPSLDSIDDMSIAISNAELKVYELLSTLDDRWYFWFSRLWIDENNQFVSMGEADFLVFHPEYGFLLLEVKGGGVSYTNGIWTTTDARNENFTIRDPFRQARRSMFFFKKFYVKMAKKEPNRGLLLSKQDDFPGVYYCGVVFPDCLFKNRMPTAISFGSKEMIFDASDLELQRNWKETKQDPISPIDLYLICLFKMFRREIRFPSEVEKFFTRIISPKIETNFLINRLINYQQEQLNEINERQDELLETFSEINRLIFKGKAGTGKTYIAMKKSLHLYQESKNVLFLCYNRELMFFIREYINNQIRSMKKTAGNILIMNIHRFLLKISEQHLIKAEYNKFVKELKHNNKEYISKIISEIISKEKLNPKYKFDAIIVDEAQDLAKDFAALLKDFLKEKEKSVFWIFYDDAQKIFALDFTITNFGFKEKIDSFSLSKNLRNVDNIIKWIEDQTKIRYKILSGIAGKEVEIIRVDSFNAALNEVMVRVFDLIYEKNLDLKQIIVLSDKKFEYLEGILPLYHGHIDGRKYFYQRYTIEQKYPGKRIYLVEPFQLNAVSRIRTQLLTENILLYQGIGTFKGLERDIVFLIIPHHKRFQKNESNNLTMRTYIGASRAKFILYVIEY